MARQVLIPFHGIEYVAGRTTLSDIIATSPDWDWNETPVPWMKYLSGGTPSVEKEPLDMLKCTWNSKATDPRDEVFGLLGLIEPAMT